MRLPESAAAENSQRQITSTDPWLRWFSKVTCSATLFLIFAGAMVKSTDSGLAVPDWPLSYGMLFPPMIGGVFYEHGHRMVAATVGFLTLCLAISIKFKEQRQWVKCLGFLALGAVVVQGVLGGITVLFFLPTPVSVFHGILAQVFFILTIFIAYSQSNERLRRGYMRCETPQRLLRLTILWTIFILVQLILGAVMRHTESGLAIPDFPKMGGSWLPAFNPAMLDAINNFRFDKNLDPVTLAQVFYHFLHRVGALLILIFLGILNVIAFQTPQRHHRIVRTLLWIDIFVMVQVILGAMTVLTIKSPLVTSLHVVTGAMILGMSFLLTLRTAPLTLRDFKRSITQNEGLK